MIEFFDKSVETFESSTKLKQIKQIDKRWETTEIGRSFSIPINKANLAQLRHKCWAVKKKSGKHFRAVQHENCYEIGRLK